MALMEGFDSQIMALAVPQIAEAWAVPAPRFALVFSAAGLGMAFGASAVGMLADRFGRKWALVLSMFFLGILTFSIALTHSLAMLVLLRFLSGICLGGTLVNVIAITGDTSPPETRVRNSMLTYTGAPSGALLGSLLGGYLFQFGDWRLIFHVGGGMAIACMLLPILFIAPGRPAAVLGSSAGKPRSRPAQILLDPYRTRTLALCAAELISVSAITLLTSWLPTIMARATGSAASASVFTSLIYFGAIVGVFGISPFLNRVGPKRLLSIIFLTAAGICIVVHVAMRQPDLLLVVALTLLGVGVIGGQVTLHTLGASLYPAQLRGTGVGLALALGRIGALIGPVIGGLLLGTPALRDSVFLVLGGIVAGAGCAVAVLAHATRNDELQRT